MTQLTPTSSAPRTFDALFEPRSVAVVGASSDPTAPGGRVLRYLRRSFQGTVLGVNRNAPVIDGLATVTTLSELDQVPDLVVVATPGAAVEGVLSEAAAVGTRAAIVFSAGFGEATDEGRAAQRRVSELAASAGMSLLGPNSLGVMNRSNGLYATFTTAAESPSPDGRVAIVGQSGGMAAMIYSVLLSQGIGVQFYCATGNEGGVQVGEAVEWLAGREEIDTIVGFVEALSAPDALARAARTAAASGTSIALCRAGRSEVGSRAVGSHVGALTGDDTVLSELCRAWGIHEASSLNDLIDIARCRHVSRPLTGRRVAVVTASGGGGALTADLLTRAGLEVPALSSELQRRMFEYIPWYGSATNPIDTTAYVQSHPDVFSKMLDELCESPEIDGLVIFLGALDPIADELVDLIVGVAGRHPDRPLGVIWGGGSRRYKTALWERGVATFDDPARAVTGMRGLLANPVAGLPSPSRRQPAPAIAPQRAELGEQQVRNLLSDWSLPVIPGQAVSSPDEAVKWFEANATRVVVKLLATGLEHKSDVGAVALDLRSAEAVAGESSRLLELGTQLGLAVEGLLIEEMSPPGIELLCAFRRDPMVGAVIVVGLGGLLTEIIGEVAVRPAPTSPEVVRDAVSQLCAGRLIHHGRGIPPERLNDVVKLLVTLGDRAASTPWLQELECNPVIISPEAVWICDGLARASTAGPDE